MSREHVLRIRWKHLAAPKRELTCLHALRYDFASWTQKACLHERLACGSIRIQNMFGIVHGEHASAAQRAR